MNCLEHTKFIYTSHTGIKSGESCLNTNSMDSFFVCSVKKVIVYLIQMYTSHMLKGQNYGKPRLFGNRDLRQPCKHFTKTFQVPICLYTETKLQMQPILQSVRTFIYRQGIQQKKELEKGHAKMNALNAHQSK